MTRFLKRSIYIKLLLVCLFLLIVPSLIIGFQSYRTAKSELDNKGEVILKNSVKQAMNLIEAKQKEVKRGNISLDTAQEEVKVFLLGEKNPDGIRTINSNIDLGENGYIYVVDEIGNVIMHPSLEGDNLWDTKAKGKNEFYFLQDQVQKALKGGGFTEYGWTLPNSKKISPKISYQDYSKDWGWVIVSSTYKQDFNSGSNNIIYIIAITLIISFIIGIILILLFARHISKPIKSVSGALEKVADGDLSVEEIFVKNNDEIGNLADSYNKMITNLKHLINTVKDSSNTVDRASTSLNEISTQTARATDEVAQTVGEIANSSSEQAKDIEDGASQINQLGKDIENIANVSDEMDILSTRTNNLTENGLKIVEILTNKSKENNIASSKVNEIILKLDDSTNQIGVITETISQISEQTNLLALNASIEAARAGEAGRGFAVVADEIRKLAEQSYQAIQGIDDILEEIQSNSHIAVKSMEESKTIVEEQSSSVNDTKNVFDEIASSITDLSEKISSVTQSSIKMNDKKEKVISMIENLSAISEETAASTQEVSAATEEQSASIQEVASYAEELNKLSKELLKEINKFNI